MSGKRITWIDNAKIIAGLLMVFDHALLYFGHEGSWLRYTITRCVEPLYVFCFAYLLSVKGRNLSPKRWKQLAIAAVIETAIHSHRAGILYFGILANLTCFGWLVGVLRRLDTRSLISLTIAMSPLAVYSLSYASFYIDYGPFLIASQTGLAILADREGSIAALTSVLCWLATLIGIGICSPTGIAVGANAFTILAGHPLTALVLGCNKVLKLQHSMAGWIIVRSPLTFYVGHLGILAAVAQTHAVLAF